MVKAGAKFHHIPEIAAIYNDVAHHSEKFNATQYQETKEAKRQLYEWAGLDYAQYTGLEDQLPPEEFVCVLLQGLMQSNLETKRFSDSLLRKNHQWLCANGNGEK